MRSLDSGTEVSGGFAPRGVTKQKLDQESRLIALCQDWLAVNADVQSCALRWGEVEARLAARHDWFKLTEAARRSLTEARELYAIDQQIEALTHRRNCLLNDLLKLRVCSQKAAAARISVAAELIAEEDFPEAHALLLSSKRGLAT